MTTRAMQEVKNLQNLILKDAWPYWMGAILLGIMNTVTFIYMSSPWGVTTTFIFWGAWISQLFGGDPTSWGYFKMSPAAVKTLQAGFFNHTGSLMNAGIIFGAFLAAAAASQFKIKNIRAPRQIAAALIGGFLMGYGARLANGCNIGAYFSSIASMSVHGWVFGIFILLGAYIGSRLLTRYFM